MKWLSPKYALVGGIFAFADIRKLYVWSSGLGAALTRAHVLETSDDA